ncbi:hypothetical protein [Sphingomonas sp. OTU376]|uniref:hypothetical protein n=1 Tax=Sphingomonas sp. OTU376 TaxID=3043863 RepID=UPI00313B3588
MKMQPGRAKIREAGAHLQPLAGAARSSCYVSAVLERHQTVLQMREQGSTFKAIGAALGVTPGRAGVLYRRALEVQSEEAAGMGMAAIRIVRHYRGDLDELAALAERDHTAAVVSLIQEPNCLRRHALQIIAWLKAGNREKP